MQKFQSNVNAKTVLTPVLFISHINGLTIFYWRKKRILIFLHRVVMLVIITASLFHELPNINYWQYRSEGFHGIIVKLEVISFWFSYYFNFILTISRNSKINAVIDSLNNTDTLLSHDTLKKIFKYHLGHMILTSGLILIYNIYGRDFVWFYYKRTYFTSTLYIIGEMVILTSFFEFIHLVHFIGRVFQEINMKFLSVRFQLIKKNLASDSNLKENEIIKLRKLHLFLSQISVKINTCYSEQVSLFF